jgi:hypothetical protein
MTKADLTPAELDAYEERAGILQFDMGMTKEAAEEVALKAVLSTRPPAQETRQGIEALAYLTAHGIGIKPHFAPTLDKELANYSLNPTIEQGKPYKAFIAKRFLVLDIDRHPDKPDGIKALCAWLETIKPRDLWPPYFKDIDRGSFPFWQETPHGGYHLFFKYSGAKPSDPQKSNFTDTQGREVPSVDILRFMIQTGWSRDGTGKPYILHGSIDQAPALPDFIRLRLPHIEKAAPVFIPFDKKKFEGDTPWPKVIEFTNKDGYDIGNGRDEYAYSLARHAMTHKYNEMEALTALQSMAWDFDKSFTQRQLEKCCHSAYKRGTA